MSNVVDIRNSGIPLKIFLKEFFAENFPLATSFYDTLNREQQAEGVDFSLNIDLFIAESKLGVAENGCLWFDDSILKQRISTFACENTILIIDHKKLCLPCTRLIKK